MDSQKVLYSQGKNDECYTPRYVVEEIVKYIPKNKIVWCHFDTDKSEFVKVLIGGWVFGCLLAYLLRSRLFQPRTKVLGCYGIESTIHKQKENL